MEYKTNFSDYTEKELLNLDILYTHSHGRGIRKIVKVTKTGFRISNLPDKLFHLTGGSQKGLEGRMNMGTVSYCVIITEKQKSKLLNEFLLIKKRNVIKNIISNVDKLDIDGVNIIHALLTKK